ncbi:MAG: APA family basic amino acid/polyamine antiporter [Gammaproteobacteria bacterium]|jgi:APA family basic amino acid/polyamine antiporter
MPELKRTISLPLITFYGLGTILGAGIYVLIGSVAGRAGIFLPLSFLLAALIAAFTAFSYAELVARLPRGGGEAVYVDEAFHHRWLTLGVGYGAVIVGIISAATIASGFAGYLRLFAALDPTLIVLTVVIVLGFVAAIGMQLSAWAATLMTLVEIAGLMLIIALAGNAIFETNSFDYQQFVPDELGDWRNIGAGAFLGFEDMVNVAEEVHNPRRNLPIAIITALIVATLLYFLVGIAAVISVPVDVLSASSAPLSTVAGGYGLSAKFMGVIALVAITNGGLIQIIKSSRILYGMVNMHDAPRVFGRVFARTNTPVIATCCVSLVVLLFALSLPTIELASLTSLVTLVIFAVVNAALLKMKWLNSHPVKSVEYPIAVPLIGMLLCLALIAAQVI